MIKTKSNPAYLLIDLGAVIYDIDYNKTIEALTKLFNVDMEDFFSKQSQSNFVDQFEEGKITEIEFCNSLKNSFNKPGIDDESIRQAWNALLIGFRISSVQYLEELSKTVNLYLYSNTNVFHYNELSERAGEAFMNRFHNCFKTVYLSHDFNHRKPHPESFTKLLTREGLRPEDGVFIDDTLHHIKGAQKAGLRTYHFQKEDRLEDILPKWFTN